MTMTTTAIVDDDERPLSWLPFCLWLQANSAYNLYLFLFKYQHVELQYLFGT